MKGERARESRGNGSNSLLYHQQAITIALPQWSEIDFIYYMKNKYRVVQKEFLVHEKQVKGGAKTSK